MLGDVGFNGIDRFGHNQYALWQGFNAFKFGGPIGLTA
jgi:hypothetical protein